MGRDVNSVQLDAKRAGSRGWGWSKHSVVLQKISLERLDSPQPEVQEVGCKVGSITYFLMLRLFGVRKCPNTRVRSLRPNRAARAVHGPCSVLGCKFACLWLRTALTTISSNKLITKNLMYTHMEHHYHSGCLIQLRCSLH